MKASELREKTDDELNQMVVDRMDDIMHFRLQNATGVVDNVKGTREARRDIARVKTIKNQRRATNTSGASDGGA